MVNSKEWNWKKADKKSWLLPSEESIYLADKWAHEGVHSILDLGCGLGRHSILFAKHGFKVTAVDLSPEAIFYAKEWKKKEHVDYLCKVSDMKTLPFSDDAFDRVFSYHVISHSDTEGIQAVIDEITRVLKPNGKVFLTLCSKAHYAYTKNEFPRIDDNTILRTEGAEIEIPHFFADKTLLLKLFHNYTFDKVRHITECNMENNINQEKSHYYIEATVYKQAKILDYSSILGSMVTCTIDRPLGTTHPRHSDIFYSINYGYVNGVYAEDKAEQDVYIIGENHPLQTYTGKVIAVYHRLNDNEDKWIVSSEDKNFTDKEILNAIEFQEKYFDGQLIR